MYMSPPEQPRYFVIASPWRRIAAWAIDMGLIFVCAVLLAALLGASHGFHSPDGRTSGVYVESSSWLPLLLVVSVAYPIPLWVLRGATLGQQALDLHVYQARQPICLGWARAVLRWFGPFGWIVFAVASLSSGLWVNVMLVVPALVLMSTAADSQNRGVHDRISQSLVVLTVSQWAPPSYWGR